MIRFLRNFFIFIFLNFLCGCVTLVHNKDLANVKIENLKNTSNQKSKIFVEWKYSSDDNSQYDYQKTSLAQRHLDLFISLINKTDCCTVVADEKSAEVLIKGSFDDSGVKYAEPLSHITGYSLFIIPMWINNKKNILVEVKKAGKRYNYDLKGSMFSAFWLPFVVALPFQTPMTKKEEMLHISLYSNLIDKMGTDRVFKFD